MIDEQQKIIEEAREASLRVLETAAKAEADLLALGRRKLNLIWECTQAVIALLVTGTGMYTASQLALRNDPHADSKSAAITAFLLISNAVFLVIGFYFGRTNQEKAGGVEKERL